ACIAGSAQKAGAESAHSFFTVDGPAILDAVKPAEGGRGWILRFYEPHGGRGTVTLKTDRMVNKVTACNHIEEDGEVIASSANSFSFPIRPFQVCTFRME
ncbi:MAG: hypothetical protein IH586_13930, partial [Anaerolineaceae bacterium]|nr:hypothetical protein [Anaerolineaceae bacterium]